MSGANAAPRPAGAASLLQALLQEKLPAETVLMRLILQCDDAVELGSLLENAARNAKDVDCRRTLENVKRLLGRHPDAWEKVSAAAAMVDHGRQGKSLDETLAGIAGGFDRAVSASAPASVALHSLGSEARLASATAEIVTWLDGVGVFLRCRDALDLGCGIGRFGPALAGRMRHVTGIDISAAMIRHARRRCAGLPNLSFRQTSGRDLADFEADSFDLVLAVDSFPYLVLAGEELAARLVEEIARVLKTPGNAVILNYSYRNRPDLDRSDLGRMARRHGLEVAVNGERPFNGWDGMAFHLVKTADRHRTR